MTITGDIHIALWGTYVTTPQVSADQAVVRVRTTLLNHTPEPQQCVLVSELLDPQGALAGRLETAVVAPADSSVDVVQVFTLSRPALWSPDAPHLYRVSSAVLRGDEEMDRYDTSFGIRWFESTNERGFFLNGRHLHLRGMCLHHDCGGIGVALPDRVNAKTVEIMKAMGCNLLRSAHNDAAPSLMEACDRLGMLVWAENRSSVQRGQFRPLEGYGNEISLRDLIRRNRNHPSIICWSLANTAGDDDPGELSQLERLHRVAHAEDPSRPTAFACEHNGDPYWSGFGLITDIMGYNGGGMGRYVQDHEAYPQQKLMISEYSSGRGARGIYEEIVPAAAPVEVQGDGRIVHKSGSYSSQYQLCLRHEAEWSEFAHRQWVAGGAMWSGIDYFGETAGWPIVTSQFGVLDVARFPNDACYYYLQEWTASPMVHLFPHWTWPGREGEEIALWCYSNCDEVELLFGGKSLSRQPRRPGTHLAWQVPYRPGTLLARGLFSGEVVCRHEVRTAGPAVRLRIAADRSRISTDDRDLTFVTIGVHDGDGTPVPTAAHEIEVEVSGPGRLRGLCSGDPASHEDQQGSRMRAFVQSDGRPGEITVPASSEGLEPAALAIIAG